MLCLTSPIAENVYSEDNPAFDNSRKAIEILHSIKELEQRVQPHDVEPQAPRSSAASSSWSPTVLKLADLLDAAATPPSAPTASSSTSWDLVAQPADDNDKTDDDQTLHLINHSRHSTKSNTFDAFHFIKGNKVYGILIDPGAAKGLIGSDTLHDLIENVLKPNHMQHLIKWQKSHNKFTGISADPQISLGMVQFPIGLKGIKLATFNCDVIGGSSSKCPALMPLISMLHTGCLISCGYFSNGDDLLGIRMPDGSFRTQRLLFTDSGHYLLPIHHFDKPTDDNLNKIIKHDFHKLQKEYGHKTTHKHKDKAHKQTTTGHLTFPVALHTDNDHDDKDNKDDTPQGPPGLEAPTPQVFH